MIELADYKELRHWTTLKKTSLNKCVQKGLSESRTVCQSLYSSAHTSSENEGGVKTLQPGWFQQISEMTLEFHLGSKPWSGIFFSL